MDGIKWLAQEINKAAEWPKGLDELDAEVIVGLADYNMNVSEAAARLYMHRNTVVYRAKKIRRVTGKDILNFYDLCEMIPAAKKYLAEM